MSVVRAARAAVVAVVLAALVLVPVGAASAGADRSDRSDPGPQPGAYWGHGDLSTHAFFSYTGDRLTHVRLGTHDRPDIMLWDRDRWYDDSCHVCTWGHWSSEHRIFLAYLTTKGSRRVHQFSLSRLGSDRPVGHGRYEGTAAHGAAVHLRFDGEQVRGLTWHHQHLGHVSVDQLMRFHVCHGDVCVHGQWRAPNRVVGRTTHPGDDSVTHWEAFFEPDPDRGSARAGVARSSGDGWDPQYGWYGGHDFSGHVVMFRVHPHHVSDVSAGHHEFGGAPLEGRHFRACQHHLCLAGAWTSETTFSGAWHDAHHRLHHFRVHAER
ncbi:hypothetical protein [Nocardioides sp.]|uniref:hypothetical protein n=1 Tax=Nocardioides sp. TaxID=35761 RepID=UPI0037852EB3